MRSLPPSRAGLAGVEAAILKLFCEDDKEIPEVYRCMFLRSSSGDGETLNGESEFAPAVMIAADILSSEGNRLIYAIQPGDYITSSALLLCWNIAVTVPRLFNPEEI